MRSKYFLYAGILSLVNDRIPCICVCDIYTYIIYYFIQLNLPFRLYQTKPGPVREITESIPTDGTPVEFIEREVVFIRNGNKLRAGWYQTGAVIIAESKFFPNIQQNYLDVSVRVPRSYIYMTRGLFGIMQEERMNAKDLFAKDGKQVIGTKDEEVYEKLLSCKFN